MVAIAGAILAGAAATSVVNGLYQAYNAAQARKASQAELNRIADMIAKVESPDFDMTQLTPEEYKVVGKYNPQFTAFVEELAPGLIEGKSEASQEGLAAQRSALRKMIELGRTGKDLESEVAQQRAAQGAQIAAHGTIGQIKQNLQQRGMSGGGTELLQSLLAAQGAQTRGALTSQDAAIEAQRRKLQSIRDAASLGGDIRQTELGMEGKNVDIINQYNQRNAQRRQDWGNTQTNTANDAQLRNLQAEQSVADANVGTRNTFNVNERNRSDTLTQQQYDNEMAKVRAQAGIADAKSQSELSAGRDRGAVAQGVTDAAQTALAYAARPKTKAEEDEEDEEDKAGKHSLFV